MHFYKQMTVLQSYRYFSVVLGVHIAHFLLMAVEAEVVDGVVSISGSQTGHVEQFRMDGYNYDRVVGVQD